MLYVHTRNGVPIKSSNSIIWIHTVYSSSSGIPVATVALNGAKNAAILATQMMAIHNKQLYSRLSDFKESMKAKVIEANHSIQKQ